jgi:hypothetical protein
MALELGSGIESREYDRGYPLRRPRNILYPQKLALISPTSSGRSVDIVRSRTEDRGLYYYATTWEAAISAPSQVTGFFRWPNTSGYKAD